MPKAIYVPDGIDPTEQEYPIPGTGLATFSLAILAVLLIAGAFALGLFIGKPKQAASPTTATASKTSTPAPSSTVLSLPVYHVTFTPTSTGTLTPSATPSASPSASPSPSPTPTQTATKRPSKTPRPAKHTAAADSGTPPGFEISVAVATFTIDDGSSDLGPPLGPWTMVPIATDTGGWQVLPAWPSETPTS